MSSLMVAASANSPPRVNAVPGGSARFESAKPSATATTSTHTLAAAMLPMMERESVVRSSVAMARKSRHGSEMLPTKKPMPAGASLGMKPERFMT